MRNFSSEFSFFETNFNRTYVTNPFKNHYLFENYSLLNGNNIPADKSFEKFTAINKENSSLNQSMIPNNILSNDSRLLLSKILYF